MLQDHLVPGMEILFQHFMAVEVIPKSSVPLAVSEFVQILCAQKFQAVTVA